jgi:hypothetical protein
MAWETATATGGGRARGARVSAEGITRDHPDGRAVVGARVAADAARRTATARAPADARVRGAPASASAASRAGFSLGGSRASAV